jgi:chromosome segregation ATPase
MPAAKSEHPGLVKTAMEKFGTMKKGLGKLGPVVKDLGAAATALKSAADDADKAFKDQLSYCEKLIEKYATKANEIAEIEADLDDAKGDKKAEAELLKKHKKADGEASAIRKDYAQATEVFRTLSGLVESASERVATAAGRFAAIKTGE